MTGFKKLKAGPVEDHLYFDYELENPEEKDPKKMKFKPVQDNGVKVWLHPLTASELEDVDAVGMETLTAYSAKGGEPKDSVFRSERAKQCLSLFYSVRAKDGRRLFDNELEVAQLEVLECVRLTHIYDLNFVPTRAEIKNSLRERLGLDSETESSSPKISETQGSRSPGDMMKRTPTTSGRLSGT